MALTVKSTPFCKLFEIFHLESLRLGWSCCCVLHRWGRTAKSSPRGHDGADNRAGKSSAYIFSGRKDSLMWLCPPTSGGASPGGTSALSRAGPSGTLPHLPSLLPAVGSILRGPWHVPKLSPLPVEVYFKTSYYR